MFKSTKSGLSLKKINEFHDNNEYLSCSYEKLIETLNKDEDLMPLALNSIKKLEKLTSINKKISNETINNIKLLIIILSLIVPNFNNAKEILIYADNISYDENENIGFDLTIPVEIDNQELLFKVGLDKSNNNRNAQVRSYRFLAEGGPIPPDGLDNRIDYIFEDKNFDPSRLIVIENTAASSPAGYLGVM